VQSTVHRVPDDAEAWDFHNGGSAARPHCHAGNRDKGVS
jgi:hypothetical protein